MEKQLLFSVTEESLKGGEGDEAGKGKQVSL